MVESEVCDSDFCTLRHKVFVVLENLLLGWTDEEFRRPILDDELFGVPEKELQSLPQSRAHLCRGCVPIDGVVLMLNYKG